MALRSSRALLAAALLAALVVAARGQAAPTNVALTGGLNQLTAQFDCPDAWWTLIEEVSFELTRTDVSPAVTIWTSWNGGSTKNNPDDALANQRGKAETGELTRDATAQRCSFTITSASIAAASSGNGQGTFTLALVSAAAAQAW